MATERLRGRQLQEMRAKHLRLYPLCQRCIAHGVVRPGVEVDHVVPLFKGGEDVPANRQTLCKPCHVDKTCEDMGHRVRPVIGVDGVPQNPDHPWNKN